jgi:hypothetical protein
LEELIQVNCGNYATIELKKGFSGIPPRVNDPGRKKCISSGLHNRGLSSDSCTQCACLHSTLFSFPEMHVGRRSLTSWRERALDYQDHLTGNITLSTHPKSLPGVTILQSQNAVHAHSLDTPKRYAASK